MRSWVSAALALTAALTAAFPTQAQEPAPAAVPSVPASVSPALPKGPIPYTALAAKPRSKPKPATPTVAAAQPVAGLAAASSTPPAALPTLPPGVRADAGAKLAAGQPIPPAQLEAFVDGVVSQAMAREHIAGVTVAVVQNGQVLLKKGYGFASLSPRRPVDPDRTLFRVGSISKTFTWIGLMQEVEAGRIRLDQPVNLYLPERVRVRDQGYDRPVRVRDLMAHAAGFEDRAFGQLFVRDPDYVRPLELYLRRERVRRVRPPGQAASYSNYGAGLAGEALAYVTGRPFERLMEDEIFLPLGMGRTTFREMRPPKAWLPAPMPAALAADVSDGFRWTRGGFERRPYEYIGQIAPAGSASSTAGDMSRYMLALLGGGQLGGTTLYGSRTAQAFRTPILATPPGINGWAHGFIVETLPGERRGYGHAGSTVAFMSNMVTAPSLNLGVFVAANTDTGERLVLALPAAIVREFFAAPQPFPRAGSSALAAAPERFAGRYLSSRRAYGGLEGFAGRLAGDAVVRITPEGRLVTTDGGVQKAWVPEGDPADGRFIALIGDERLAFTMRDGQATGFMNAANVQRFERTSAWRSPGTLGLLAGLTVGAAIVSLAGAMLRNRRELRESQVQSRAALVQNLQAGLWLIAMVSFGVWGAGVLADPARLVFGWPGPLLITASACALVAATLTLPTLLALPAVWRGGRRVDTWPVLRRTAFTVTAAIYTAFAVLLAQSGALSPWGL
ncbi:serine hydrolase [Phenylobacterium sp. LjRoot219]|uniref:serine hydrolase domain-containing protein n=1 Tax=Phenylobacterium sp. LjRoot219 TaxID=3342283 RepID=UPI003ED0F168